MLARRTGSLRVVLERLHKPRNQDAILRTCDVFGVQHVHLIPQEGEDPSPPQAHKITRGCEQWLTLHRHRDAAECYRALHAEGFRILAATLGEGALPLEESVLAGKVALVFGNELAGVTGAAAGEADGLFVIPMAGFSQSLNVSVAAGIALREARRVKEREGRVGDLAPAEARELREAWIRSSVREAEAVERHLAGRR